MRVLLIDDHALFRAGLQGLLERRGIQISMASDGRRGIVGWPWMRSSRL